MSARLRCMCTLATGLALLISAPSAVAQTEACCEAATGACIDVDPMDCPGTPQGSGTVCTQPEACCLGATCVLLDPLCCGDQGGTPMGNLTCSGVDCQQEELCPLANSYCQSLHTTDCLSIDPLNEFCWPKAISGTAQQQPVVDACECFREDECGPVQIVPIGAPPTDYTYSCVPVTCPLPVDVCQIHLDFGMGPFPWGPSINASQLPAGVVVTCDCSPAEQDEACCLQDGTCIVTTPTDCVMQGGTPQGVPNCSSNAEACCLPDDTCEMLDPLCCNDQGGHVIVGATCGGAVEGCCLPDNTCIMADPLCCLDQGGTPQGTNSTCTALEACCLPDGTCTMLDPLCCDDAGGTSQGAGLSCTQVEACCLPDGTCQDLDPLCCADQGGTSQGVANCSSNAEACCFTDGTCQDLDPLCCVDQGGTPQGNPSDCASLECEGGEPVPVIIEWSMDIGGDTELSDPNADGDEGGDPGDVYLWRGPPYRPPLVPCGRDGFKDDAFIFGTDPSPNPPDCALPPLTAVPVGNGGDPTDEYARFFDLDGHDQIEFNIEQFLPPTAPLEFPIPQDQIAPLSACVHPPEFLLFSYDDDMAPGWPAGDVPVTAPSPAGLTYGTSGGNDEIVGKTLALALALPFATVVDYRPFDEIDVHTDMAPNPDLAEQDDDDVDSLDAVRDLAECPFWYFTADHEAHLGLDPGSIYLATGLGPPTLVIDDVIHLGLPESTDVDAFEFAWLPADLPGGVVGPALAVLFSVDENDPLTPLAVDDESGGLDPKQIYGSFLTGSNFPVIVAGEEPTDDVDALTIWVAELLPLCSSNDVNCDGFVNATDIGIVGNGANFQVPAFACDRADVNGDGFANATDIGIIGNGANFQKNPTGPCFCVTATPGPGGPCAIP